MGVCPRVGGLFLPDGGWCVCSALGHAFDEAGGGGEVLVVGVEVLAGDVPVGALAGAACLDVCGLFAGLPSADEDDGALDGGALLAVDVLGVGEADGLEVVECEGDAAV